MLQNLQQISTGYWLLAVVAIGLISYGVIWLRRNYRAGKFKIKMGVVEAEFDRKPEVPTPFAPTGSPPSPSSISPSSSRETPPLTPKVEGPSPVFQPTQPAEAGEGHDVFISCAAKDEPWVVTELLPSLENAQLTIYLDFRDHPVGVPKPVAQERAILNSRKTLLILSPAFVQDQWRDFESILLQTLDPTNLQLRLIPLLKEECSLPLRLSMLTAVDFTHPERNAIAWTQLLRALAKP